MTHSTPSHPAKRRLLRLGVVLSLVGALILAAGVAVGIRDSDVLVGGNTTTELPTGAVPTGEVVYNERMSIYRPPAESLVADATTGTVFVQDEAMVMFKAGVTAHQAEQAIAGWGGKVVGKLTAISRYEVLLPKARSLGELRAYLAQLETDPLVEIAYANELTAVTMAYQPDDAGWRGEWNGPETIDGNWGMEAINAPTLWDYRNEVAKGLSATPVGIIDGGFVSNADVKVDALAPIAAEDHGTHVAGTIGASFDNDEGVAGVVPGDVKMYGFSTYALRTQSPSWMPSDGDGYDLVSTDDLGLVYLVAERHARVLNFSMAASDLVAYAASHGNAAARDRYRADSKRVRHTVGRLLEEHDFLLCAAAGNEGGSGNAFNTRDDVDLYLADEKAEYGYKKADGWWQRLWAHRGGMNAAYASDFAFIGSEYDDPGSSTEKELAAKVHDHILVVGAAKLEGGKMTTASLSNEGSRVDVKAPGVHIQSLVEKSKGAVKCGTVLCGTWDGTSMATPHVTGSAAALWAMNTSLTSQDIRKLLLDTKQSSSWCPDQCFLDVGAAATKLMAEYPPVGTVQPPGEDSPSTVTSIVLDTSGSMSDSSGRTEVVDLGEGKTETRDIPKIEVAKQASHALVKMVKSTALRATSSYQLGLVRFDTSATAVEEPTTALGQVESAIDGMEADGGTDLLEALRAGGNQLAGRSGTRTMIMLTDGKDESGNSDEDILAAAQELHDQGIKICTVGFGTSGDLNTALLQQVAARGACSYSHADPSSSVALAGSFIAAQLRGTSSVVVEDTGAVSQGATTAAVGLDVPNETGDLTAVLYWPGSTLDVMLTDPAGVAVDQAYPGAAFDTSQIPSQVVITDPKPGKWSMAVRGVQTSADQEPYYAVGAFRAVERQYQVNQVPPLSQAGPVVTRQRPDMVLSLGAVGLPIGLFLLVLGLSMVAASRPRSR